MKFFVQYNALVKFWWMNVLSFSGHADFALPSTWSFWFLVTETVSVILSTIAVLLTVIITFYTLSVMFKLTNEWLTNCILKCTPIPRESCVPWHDCLYTCWQCWCYTISYCWISTTLLIRFLLTLSLLQHLQLVIRRTSSHKSINNCYMPNLVFLYVNLNAGHYNQCASDCLPNSAAAEHGIATAIRPSICPSVTLRYRRHYIVGISRKLFRDWL